MISFFIIVLIFYRKILFILIINGYYKLISFQNKNRIFIITGNYSFLIIFYYGNYSFLITFRYFNYGFLITFY